MHSISPERQDEVAPVTRAEVAAGLSKEDALARLQLALRAADIGIWEWNLADNSFMYSTRAREICGFAADGPVTYEMVVAVTHPEDLPRTSALARGALDPLQRRSEPYEYRIIRQSDGAVRWVVAHGHAVFEEHDGADRAIRYIGTIQDVTKRRERDLAIAESEQRLRLAVEAGRMAVWVYEVATDNIATSPALNRLLGFPEDATPSSEELRAGYLTGERERVSVIARAALARGEPYFEAEYEYRRRDGRPIWLLMRAEIMLDRSGEPERVVGVVLDITERKRAEEHRAILVEELNHRVKNTLAVVQSIATMSLRADADPALARQRFVERITALAKTHDVLTRENWTGAGLRDIFQQTLSPFDERISGRIVATGPDIWLPPRLAVSFSLMINELITNALKYGALSVPEGSVSLNWSDGEMFTLTWIERQGPPVLPPSRKGFGTALLHRGFVREINGTLDLRYEPEGLELAMRGTPPHLVPSADNMAAE